eukprot:345560-Lingulodinium_polyedra.AAC.1
MVSDKPATVGAASPAHMADGTMAATANCGTARQPSQRAEEGAANAGPHLAHPSRPACLAAKPDSRA